MTTTRKIRFTIGILLFAVLLIGVIPTAASGSAPAGCDCPPAITHRAVGRAGNPSGWRVFMATNASRRRHQVPGVILSRRLSDLARDHSRRMGVNHRLFHSPNPGIYLRRTGWSSWGENVGWTTGATSDLQQAFMQSQVHRHNILDGRFRRVGVGAIRVGDTLWVTVFLYG